MPSGGSLCVACTWRVEVAREKAEEKGLTFEYELLDRVLKIVRIEEEDLDRVLFEKVLLSLQSAEELVGEQVEARAKEK